MCYASILIDKCRIVVYSYIDNVAFLLKWPRVAPTTGTVALTLTEVTTWIIVQIIGKKVKKWLGNQNLLTKRLFICG